MTTNSGIQVRPNSEGLASLGFVPSHGFQLPPGWSWDLLERALSPRKSFTVVDDHQLYKRVTVKLHGQGIVLRDTVLGSVLTTKEQQIIRTDDFLVAEIDAKMGAFGIVPPELDGAIVSSHYFIFEIDQTKLLPGYLEAFVRVGYLTESISQFVRGSLNYAAIRPRHVLSVVFPYAPARLQKLIIEKLAAVERAQKALEEQLGTIDKLPAALLRRAFSGEL